MGRYFDEVMRLSKAGYIDNLKDVREITDRLVNSAMDTLVTPDLYTSKMGKQILEWLDLPSDDPQNVLFGDFLNAIRVVCLDSDHIEWAGEIRKVLRKTEGYNANVKLFMAVPIVSLAELMNERSGTEKCSIYLDRLKALTAELCDFTITETTTINQLFDKFEWAMTYWDSLRYFDDFVQQSSKCCEIIKLLMIDFFRIGYSEMFVLSGFKNRMAAGRDDWITVDYFGIRFDDVSYDRDFFDNRYIPGITIPDELPQVITDNDPHIIADISSEHDDYSRDESTSSGSNITHTYISDDSPENPDLMSWDDIVKMIKNIAKKAG